MNDLIRLAFVNGGLFPSTSHLPPSPSAPVSVASSHMIQPGSTRPFSTTDDVPATAEAVSCALGAAGHFPALHVGAARSHGHPSHLLASPLASPSRAARVSLSPASVRSDSSASTCEKQVCVWGMCGGERRGEKRGLRRV